MTLLLKKNLEPKASVFLSTMSEKSFLGDFLVTPFEKVMKILNKISACLQVHDENFLLEDLKYVISKIENRSLYSYYENDFTNLNNNNDKNNIEIRSFIDSINEYSEKPVNPSISINNKYTGNLKRPSKIFRTSKAKFNTMQVNNKEQIKQKLDERIQFQALQNKIRNNDSNKPSLVIEECDFFPLEEQLRNIKYFSSGLNEDLIQQIDKNLVTTLESQLTSKSFNIFDFYDKYQNSSFNYMTRYMLKALDLYPLINIENLESFCNTIKNGYKETSPYHNQIHGVDVAHSLYTYMIFSNDFETKFKFEKIDILSLMIAAVCHDIGHPGFNNGFHINSLSSYAVQYNDKSVLENYHASEATRILLIPENNILDNMDKDNFKIFRKRFIEAILSTDMTLHVKTNSLIKTKLQSNNISKGQNIESLIPDIDDKFQNQQELLNYFLHTADIAHNTKNFDISLKWVCNLSQEFWNQGDVEKSMNLPISFLCDRTTADVPKSQIGFIKGIIVPSFEILLDMLPELFYISESIEDNLDKWGKMTMRELESKLKGNDSIQNEDRVQNKEMTKQKSKKKVEFIQHPSSKSKLNFEIHFQAINLDSESVIDN